jgi:hypothetical protein
MYKYATDTAVKILSKKKDPDVILFFLSLNVVKMTKHSSVISFSDIVKMTRQ